MNIRRGQQRLLQQKGCERMQGSSLLYGAWNFLSRNKFVSKRVGAPRLLAIGIGVPNKQIFKNSIPRFSAGLRRQSCASMASHGGLCTRPLPDQGSWWAPQLGKP